MKFSLLAVLAFIEAALAVDGTAYVNLASTRGAPTGLASGFIYGMPLNETNQIPDHFYSDIAIKWGRAGGAQLPAPCRGWAFGTSEYTCRFNAMMLNYKQTRKFGAQFIILPHDLWGIDYRTTISDYKLPGANGDWSSYDSFLSRLISDLKANNALGGLVWDIWNEPDQSGFWGASQQQWINLYIRTHERLRSDSALNSVLISGPTLAGAPSTGNSWWTNWASQVGGNQTYPDQYVWHTEGGGTSGDPDATAAPFATIRSTYGLPSRPVNINEYATAAEETPSGYAWWISRLERHDYAGLLGLWHAPLYDNFANLLTKSPGDPQDPANTNYVRAAGFPVYQYYAKSMVGTRATTTGTTYFDSYATIGAVGDQVRILAGTRAVTGNYTLQIQGLTSVGYASSGTLNARYYAFYGSDDVFDEYGDPVFLGTQSVPITNGVANLNVYVPNKHTGWRIEFPRK